MREGRDKLGVAGLCCSYLDTAAVRNLPVAYKNLSLAYNMNTMKSLAFPCYVPLENNLFDLTSWARREPHRIPLSPLPYR